MCAVNDICQSALALVKEMAAQKRQQLVFAESPTSMTVSADPRRLKQMLGNLLSNAAKFTPEGGQLGLSVVGDTERHVVEFRVWDKGIGIAAEDLPRLFKPFTQLDSGLAREYAGTGLGLALVQRMAHLHGGEIRVESTLGEGSTFTLTLPWTERYSEGKETWLL
jgi:signal transduction histidine kinase